MTRPSTADAASRVRSHPTPLGGCRLRVWCGVVGVNGPQVLHTPDDDAGPLGANGHPAVVRADDPADRSRRLCGGQRTAVDGEEVRGAHAQGGGRSSSGAEAIRYGPAAIFGVGAGVDDHPV
eukprot:scaffold7703_cov103-Isochrysis_galbana.AAC.10